LKGNGPHLGPEGAEAGLAQAGDDPQGGHDDDLVVAALPDPLDSVSIPIAGGEFP
jgi:hypothetical protein